LRSIQAFFFKYSIFIAKKILIVSLNPLSLEHDEAAPIRRRGGPDGKPGQADEEMRGGEEDTFCTHFVLLQPKYDVLEGPRNVNKVSVSGTDISFYFAVMALTSEAKDKWLVLGLANEKRNRLRHEVPRTLRRWSSIGLRVLSEPL
jgi:hypothetical protein